MGTWVEGRGSWLLLYQNVQRYCRCNSVVLWFILCCLDLNESQG